jgi:pimeloyl-ACP methyl ester carboxylesterase
MALRENRITANGIDFAYLEDGSGPLALCLHGFPDTAWGWESLASDLVEAGFRAVAPFMRGYAPTQIPPDGRYQSGALATDAIALHEALGGDETAVIVGHDWGALAAYGATNHTPDRWRRAVIASIPPAEIMMPLLMSYDVLKNNFWYQFVLCTPLADLAVAMNDLEFIERLWADWSPGYDGSAHLDRVKQALRDPGNLSAALGYYRQTLGGVEQDPSLAEIQAATFQPPGLPTLYLHGADDGCAPCPEPADLDRLFSVDGSRVEIVDGAGHFLQYEQPDRVNASIVEFLCA